MTKKTISFIFFIFLTFVLISCDKEINNDDSANISFFGWGSAEEQENFQALINQFMEENEDINVVYSAVPSEQYMRTLKNKINSLPDVFYIPDTDFIQFADANRLLNLDDYIEQEELEDLWEKARVHYLYNRETYQLQQGSLYALPKDLGPFAMVMNVDLFNQIINDKGLDIELPNPDIPMTWDEFVTLNKSLSGTYNGKRVYGVTHYELAAAVYSNNANFISEDGKTQKITDSNFKQAVQFIADLDLVHKVMPDVHSQASINGFQRFLNSGAIFSFMGPWDLKGFWNNLNFEFDLIPLPVGPAEGAKSTAWIGSMGIAVSAKSKEKEAAVKLAKFLTISQESQREFYKLGQSIPNLKTIAYEEFLENVGFEGKKLYPKNKKMFVSIVEGNEYVTGKSRITYYTYENIWYEDFMDVLLVVYNGSKTAAKVMDDYAATMQSLLDESNSYIE